MKPDSKCQNVVHRKVCLNLRNCHIDDAFYLAEGHGFYLIQNLHHNNTHSFGTLKVIAHSLTDTSV